MYQYDKVLMTKVSGKWTCASNTIYQAILTDVEQLKLARYGYVFRDLSGDSVEIIVNRMDVDSLTKASTEFYATHQ